MPESVHGVPEKPLPDISVIIATTGEPKRANTLRRAVASVRQQKDVQVFPIVVVNGASYDQAAINDLQLDPGIELHLLHTPSLPGALRFGRSIVKSTFFAFLDDDDEYMPDTLRLRVQPMLDDNTIDVVATNGYKCHDGREVLAYGNFEEAERDVLKAIVEGANWLPSCGAAFRSATVGLDYFDGATKFLEWTFLTFRLAITHRRIKFINQPTFRWHDTPDSLSKSTAYLIGKAEVIEKMFSLNPPKRILPALRRKHARALHVLCSYYRIAGDFVNAWKCHVASLRYAYGLRYLPYTALLILRTRVNRSSLLES